MYTKDKVHRITLRLNDEQFDFVKCNSDILGVSPSDFLRMIVNATMSTTKSLSNDIGGFAGRENDKSNINSII